MSDLFTTAFLDRTLHLLKDEYAYTQGISPMPEFVKGDRKLLERAFYKLEKDGYAYTKDVVTASGKNIGKTFCISFDGLLALETPPLFWKNKPYKWKEVNESLNTLWNVGKVVVIFLNALFLLLLAILTYLKPL